MKYDWLLAGAEERELTARQKPLFAAGYAFLLLYAIAAHVSIAIASIAIAGGVLTLIILLFSNRRRVSITRQQAITGKVFILFCLCVGLTTPFSNDPSASIIGTLGTVGRFMPMFLAMFFIISRKQIKWLVIALVASVLIADIAAIGHLLKGEQTKGFLNNRIYFANQLLPMVILSIACLFDRQYSITMRSFIGLAAVLTIGVFVFSMVRGAWVAAAAVYLIFILTNKRLNRKIVASSGVLGIAVITCFLIRPELLDRLKTIVTANAGSLERINMWFSAWKMFMDSPLFGLGYRQFGHYFTTDYHYLMPGTIYTGYAHPHNVFMTFLAETGLVGTIPFLCFFAVVLYYTYSNYYRANSIPSMVAFLATWGFLVGGLTDNVFAMPTVMRIIALLIGISLSNVVTEKQLD